MTSDVARRLAQACSAAPRRALIACVKAYRLVLKPWLGNACRFEPTCSQYALTALERHGAIAGGSMAVWRILRCNPWCDGGCDEVPSRPPVLFTRLGLGKGAEPAVNARPRTSDKHRPDTAVTPASRVSATTVQEFER